LLLSISSMQPDKPAWKKEFNMKFEDLDAHMRQFELSLDRHITDFKFLVARLDGRGFTKLTK
jgi:hypothetical protein